MDEQLSIVVTNARAALRRANETPFVFRRGDALVRVIRDDDGRRRLVPIDAPTLRGILARVCQWVDRKGGDENPPAEVVADLLALPDKTLPTLEALVHVPVVDPAGRIVSMEGYDASSRIYYAPAPGFGMPEVRDRPTRTVVRDAMRLLCEVIQDFPFASQGDRAHAFAALLLPFMRPLVDGPTPFHLVTATRAGTGKTLLASVVAEIATGRPAEVTTLPDSSQEVGYSLTALLMRAPTVVVLDNIGRHLDAVHLASVVTSATFCGRRVGSSAFVEMSNRATWILTGNNVSASAELARRSILISLDASVERPERRGHFRHRDLLGWIRRHRGRIVHAVLTVIAGWIAAGRPRTKHVLGSFEEWARTMGGILRFVGVEGFLGDSARRRDGMDPETGAWKTLAQAWAARHGAEPIGIVEVANLMSEVGDPAVFGPLLAGDEYSAKARIATELRRHRDQVIAGRRLIIETNKHAKANAYRLVAGGGGTPPPPQGGSFVGKGGGEAYPTTRARRARRGRARR